MEKKSFKEILSDPQNIIALGVTLISVCALIVSIMQTRIMAEQRVLMHEQAKASVWPRLNLGINKSHNTDDYKIINYAILLSNDGVGPAIISGVRVSFDEKVVLSWWKLFDEFELADSIETFIGNAKFNNTIIKIGKTTKILDLSNNLPLAQAFYDHYDKIKIEIIYESIYGDAWKCTITPKDISTIPIDSGTSFPISEQFKN